MEKRVSNAPITPDMREGLIQALFDHSFAILLLFDIDDLPQIFQEQGQVTGDRIIAHTLSFCQDRGWRFYRVDEATFAVIVSEEKPWDEVFFADLRTHLLSLTGIKVNLSGGGVKHPGTEFVLFPKMINLLLRTAHELLLLAKKRGHNQLLWLLDDDTEDVAHLLIERDFFRDLARLQASRSQILEMESRTDFLTGLHNRRGFEDVFQRIVRRARTKNKPLALFYMDSDSLKTINDSKGHDAGDRFIIDLSRVLSEALRGSDLISRWGADEFATVIEDTSREEALAIAKRLNRAIAKQTEGTMSIGMYFGVPDSVEEAMKKADDALYRVKNRGKNDVELAE
jgi:diguanylate cyclase (GGDEF)-like protein